MYIDVLAFGTNRKRNERRTAYRFCSIAGVRFLGFLGHRSILYTLFVGSHSETPRASPRYSSSNSDFFTLYGVLVARACFRSSSFASGSLKTDQISRERNTSFGNVAYTQNHCSRRLWPLFSSVRLVTRHESGRLRQ